MNSFFGIKLVNDILIQKVEVVRLTSALTSFWASTAFSYSALSSAALPK